MTVSVMCAAEIRTELQLHVKAASVQKLKARKLFKNYRKSGCLETKYKNVRVAFARYYTNK